LAEIRANEKTLVESMKGGAYRKSHAPGMSFPLTDKAVAALKKLVVAASVAAPKKKVAVASAVPKKFSSPASTPLPASPVASQESSTIKALAEVSVADDEWDDDEAKEEKKEQTTATAETQESAAEAEEEKEAEVEAAAEEEEEEEPEVVVKQERTINFVKLVSSHFFFALMSGMSDGCGMESNHMLTLLMHRRLMRRMRRSIWSARPSWVRTMCTRTLTRRHRVSPSSPTNTLTTALPTTLSVCLLLFLSL
jgi:chemotaxis protein histidine kinase CheA